jgi:hypothetical protein
MTSNSLSKEDVINRAESLDFPSSVVEFFQGYLGQPVGGFPEPLRTKIIRNKPRIDGRPGATMEPLDFKQIKAELRSKFGKHITDADVTSYVMYPKVCFLCSAYLSVAKGRLALRYSRNTKASLRSMVILGQLLDFFHSILDLITLQRHSHALLPWSSRDGRGNAHLYRERKDLDYSSHGHRACHRRTGPAGCLVRS